MYKILVKYKSTSKKVFWYEYKDNTDIPFITNDVEVLKAEINNLIKDIGYENIRIVDDITYDILVGVTENGECRHEIATQKDIDNIYNTAFKNVFSDK